MTNEEMLTELIVSANQSYLEQYGVTLKAKNLTFSLPVAGEFENGANTKIHAQADGVYIEGDYVYYYKRADMQEAFADIGVVRPTVTMDEYSAADLLVELRKKYNFVIYPSEVLDLQRDGDVCTITVVSSSLVWVGQLQVWLTQDELEELAVAFPNNILNGLDDPYLTRS